MVVVEAGLNHLLVIAFLVLHRVGEAGHVRRRRRFADGGSRVAVVERRRVH